ncbi:hypothetical protein BJX66DRAFT_299115 [Aspergillus keveii]|uniref:MYND-type domain-containing protein n=1 Tax=Aspergillus keveii TaxID=714993 RepID=A0ABR4GCF8_9EURO
MSTCAAPSCSKPGTNKCSGCKITPVRYCSKDCQRDDWKTHKTPARASASPTAGSSALARLPRTPILKMTPATSSHSPWRNMETGRRRFAS